MIIQGNTTKYNTQKEIRQIEDTIIKAAITNKTYQDIITELQQKKIKLQYEDTTKGKKNLIKRVTSKTWTEIKQEICQKAEDYSGITPTRQGYQYKNQTYPNLEDAHHSKLKRESPKLARIMYN